MEIADGKDCVMVQGVLGIVGRDGFSYLAERRYFPENFSRLQFGEKGGWEMLFLGKSEVMGGLMVPTLDDILTGIKVLLPGEIRTAQTPVGAVFADSRMFGFLNFHEREGVLRSGANFESWRKKRAEQILGAMWEILEKDREKVGEVGV